MKKEQITNKVRHNNTACDEGQEKGTMGDFRQKTTDKKRRQHYKEIKDRNTKRKNTRKYNTRNKEKIIYD